MAEQFSIDALRNSIQGTENDLSSPEDERFEALARRFERSVRRLVADVSKVVKQIPELNMVLEDEVETFTSPAFPGKEIDIRDQRIRVTRGEEMLLFDPTAQALLSAMGQVEVEATRPLTFMVEKKLYLIPDRKQERVRWGFRSVENLGGPLAPFTQQVLLRMLHCVFAAQD